MPGYAFFVTGFEETEAIATIDLLRRAEIEVLCISITGSKIVASDRGIKIETDLLFEDIAESTADFIFMPGGGGTANYYNYPDFLAYVKKHAASGRLICAICAAPTVLAELGLITDKRATCYPAPQLLDKLKTGGANFVDEIVVTDGKFITSQGPATTPYFALEIIRAVRNEDLARKTGEAFLLK